MTKRIPTEFIQDILARTDIVEIISARLKLVKKGKEYICTCPFHTENTPSFSVSPQKQFYYCFGCHVHGNAISFLMQYDRIEFIEALSYLAQQQGLELPQTISQEPQVDASLYELLNKITAYYQRQLNKSSTANDYLKTRHVNQASIQGFQLGYAPQQWDNLARHIRNQHQQSQLIACGLLIKKDNQHCYDRFRQRLMFPIRDTKGRVIAFGGRSLGDDLPKYINSPETMLFHKNRELFGLYEARHADKDIKRFILVEGYLDVIALHQHGVYGAVATLGTAINSFHLQKLLRYAKEIICCFDGDRAGHQAAWKFLTISLSFLRDDISIKFLFLPEGEDPDSLINQEGQNAFNQRLQKAIPLSHVFFTKLKRDIPIISLDSKAKFAKTASEYFANMPPGLMRDLFYKEMADLLQIDPADLQGLITEHKITTATEANTHQQAHQFAKPLTQALSILLHYPSLAKQSYPEWVYTLKLPGCNMLYRLMKIFHDSAILSTGGLLTCFEEPDEQALVASLAAKSITIPANGAQAEFLGALQRCHEQYLNQQIHELVNKAKRKELTGAEKTELQRLLDTKSIQEKVE